MRDFGTSMAALPYFWLAELAAALLLTWVVRVDFTKVCARPGLLTLLFVACAPVLGRFGKLVRVAWRLRDGKGV